MPFIQIKRQRYRNVSVWHRSDGDKNAARGAVRLLTAASHFEQQLLDRSHAALQHAHPLALLYRYEDASSQASNEEAWPPTREIQSGGGSTWAPMTRPLPQGVHLFGLGTPIPSL